ncbi:MAG TPA: TRIC cation channel family protein [Candidatus Saccharimonadales bacterium]|nr:TRIC cation channel family protein [Candidatus Saccharimonadales bacterium]
MFVHTLDLLGVFAFAAYGAHAGSRHGLDYFGMLVCASLTALGGGTIREVMLHAQPVYFHNYAYVYAMLAGVGFTIGVQAYFSKIHRYMLLLDAVGLVAFALIGASRSISAGLGLVPTLFFAVLTATGGGVMTDIVCNRKPGLFCGDFYATPVLLLALGCYALRHNISQPQLIITLLALSFTLRIAVLYSPFGKRRQRRLRAVAEAAGQ